MPSSLRISSVFSKRFEREANTWRHLEHPYILKFLGTFRFAGHLYFVSPFIKNGTLLQYVKDRENVNRVRLLCETAVAIEYLHQKSMVHGDIKASNLLISDDDHVLLCDFGLTKPICMQTSTAMKGSGTVRWQSPELWDNEPKTFKSDVYAFSMTIVELFTGGPPFPHLKTDSAVMMAVGFKGERPEKSPVECNGISYENAWKVAEGCWSKLPEERMSMSEALCSLREDLFLVP
ncbi:hypothetical protein M407DRAFT_78998 [Tulasnella calospora MUT 4182]|uniref:Protein kinase domain-containing protein n=1 Tax=Tulasnella calospora MUT 4182 TaxID=1051891 RepID=A0A0C3LMU4_9AGAM|nr:hypothetical protein M407DRAFT_78998 [Tulasnella calospora MUT 4182]